MLLGVLGHLPTRGTQGPYPPSFGPDPACPPPAFGEFSFVTRGRWRACEGLGGGLEGSRLLTVYARRRCPSGNVRYPRVALR